MASASGGSTHNPPTSAECRVSPENFDIAVFDKVYNKKGKVQIFPDVVEPRVKFFKKATPTKDPRGSRKQRTSKKDSDGHGGKTSHVGEGSRQQGRQEEVEGTKKESRVEELKSFVLDEKKTQNPNIASQLQAEECEFLVLQRVKAALEEVMEPGDPPVFILHNQGLTVKSKTDKSQETTKTDNAQETVKTGKSRETAKIDNAQKTFKTDNAHEAGRTEKSQETTRIDKSQDTATTSKSQETTTTDNAQKTVETGNAQEAPRTDKTQKIAKTDKSQEKLKVDKSQATGKTGKSRETTKTDNAQEAARTDKSKETAKTGKSQETPKTGISEGEKDVLVLHPTLGVLVLEVKGTNTTKIFSRFDKATNQLLHAQTAIREEMGDLLEKDAIVLTIALPNLGTEALSVIRNEAEERKRQKKTPDVTEGTRSTEPETVSKSASGTAEHAGVASPVLNSTPEEELLEDHPEILLLCGSMPVDFTEWVRQLIRLRASSGHAFKGSTVQERLKSYKQACMRRFSIAGLRPGQSVRDRAVLHRRFLLTEEQLRVRDSQAQLMYIWGPPGSGKTLLLVERARRWLREGKRIALTVGVTQIDYLIIHLIDSVCRDETEEAMVTIYWYWTSLLDQLDTVSNEDPVFVIVDEAILFDHSKLQDHVTAGRVGGIWSACTHPLFDENKTAFQELGGTIEQLQFCLRCPHTIIDLANKVRDVTEDLPLLPPPVPVTRELGVGVELISHADHGKSKPWEKCPKCGEEAKNFFSSLGLLGEDVTSSISLSDCIVIATVPDRERVAKWLRSLGLRAVTDEDPQRHDTPNLLPEQAPESPDQTETGALLAWVVKGTGRDGNPILCVVDNDEFRGLERAVVVLWHEDKDDENKGKQGLWDRFIRTRLHCFFWFRAISRCQGRLLVMATTPSPALPYLPVSSSAKQRQTPPERKTTHRRRRSRPHRH